MILTSSLLCLCVDSKNLETILFIRVKSLPVITFPFVHSFSFPGVSDCLFFSYTICLCRIFNLKRKQNKQTRKHFLRAGMAVRVGWGGRCTVQVMRDRIYYRSCTISHLHHMWENYLSRAHTHTLNVSNSPDSCVLQDLEPCYPKCGLWTSIIGFTRDFVRNAEHQLTQSQWIRICILARFPVHLYVCEVWEALVWVTLWSLPFSSCLHQFIAVRSPVSNGPKTVNFSWGPSESILCLRRPCLCCYQWWW